MTFTDDDLKWLKKLPDNVVITFKDGPSVKLTALLARMEASEWVLKGFIKLEEEKENYDEVCRRVQAWRKAAGK